MKPEEFDKLVPKARKAHKYAWCVKYQAARFTDKLKGEECCNCAEFVVNETGNCDPL